MSLQRSEGLRKGFVDDDDEYENFYGAITRHMLLQGRPDKKPVACQRYDFSKWCGE